MPTRGRSQRLAASSSENRTSPRPKRKYRVPNDRPLTKAATRPASTGVIGRSLTTLPPCVVQVRIASVSIGRVFTASMKWFGGKAAALARRPSIYREPAVLPPHETWMTDPSISARFGDPPHNARLSPARLQRESAVTQLSQFAPGALLELIACSRPAFRRAFTDSPAN